MLGSGCSEVGVSEVVVEGRGGGGEGPRNPKNKNTFTILNQFSSVGSRSIRDSETGEHGNKERR